MDVLLLITAGVSVTVALVMALVAWRLAREQRARSAARVAALAAAAQEVQREPTHVPATHAAPERLAVAAAAPVALEPPRLAVGSSRPWAKSSGPSGRVQSPAEASHMFPSEGRDSDQVPTRGATHNTESSRGLLDSAVPRAGASAQRRLAIAACVLLAVIIGVGYVAFYTGAPGSTGAAAAAAQTAAPLELVSLRHERRAGQLAITGLVRNPSGGAQVDELVAVVFLFDQQGGFLTSARAGVDFKTLGGGDESPFVINVDAPSKVARYRVSFRTERGVVPHVDRRGHEPIARELP
jgi:hypothetical protein